jgi:hypothetical protein
MGKSPSWEANRFSVVQEIPCLLYNAKVHCRAHKSQPLTPFWARWIRSTPYFFSIHFNIIFPSTPMSPFRSFEQNFMSISQLSHACSMSDQSNPLSFLHPNNICWIVKKLWNWLLRKFFDPPVTSFHKGQMFSSAAYSPTHSTLSMLSLTKKMFRT